MRSEDSSSLHLSLLIFISASELKRDSPMVERLAVLMSWSWLKLSSLSQDVTGRTAASLKRACTFGYAKELHSLRAPVKVCGTSPEYPFHWCTHKLYSVANIALSYLIRPGLLLLTKKRQYRQESGKIVITWIRLATTHALKPLTTVNI